MNNSLMALSQEDKTVLCLKNLYRCFGYDKYKLSCFEEYGFYLKYKSFLQSDKILSFTDLDGRLMALKPDITLSIIKNARDNSSEPQKLYYNETVYRENTNTSTFKEINQMGLEYIGCINQYALCEVALLAKMSLCEISCNNVLELSHLGFVTGLLEFLGIESEKEDVLKALKAKSAHSLRNLCKDKAELLQLCEISGSFENSYQKAKMLCKNNKMEAALAELKAVNDALTEAGQEGIRLDFTLLNDTEFYDGLLMAGYVEGVAHAVLSGGGYNSMMQKLKKSCGAIGFAVYLSELEYVKAAQPNLTDIVIYSNGGSEAKLLAAVSKFAKQGLKCMAVPKGAQVQAKESYLFDEKGLKKC